MTDQDRHGASAHPHDDASAPRAEVFRGPTEPPEHAVAPERHPQAPEPGAWLGTHYDQCFGCGEQRPEGLHLRVAAGPGVSVTAEFKVAEAHQGAPGLIHGGLLSAAFDEVMGTVSWLLRVPAVTGRLETDFLKPVPVGRIVHLRAWCVGQAGRKFYHRAEARLDGPEGLLVAKAAALFVGVKLEHFVTHGRQEDVQAVLEDPQRYRSLRAFDVNP
ncbi:PaaI family thioesterase [Actinospica durhamensis]|uniref:Acyl-coenzyme A thioesterase THEM4 n=1 Tax=Actinospica durhamensis TaxID=1508375 RepID=A0A941EPP0_9ACTN|nr:PaaI family thioesterase [Actinospica durhamensis]MBR7836225.1 PaaI family thioesterase [Actinospica durhamensis]